MLLLRLWNEECIKCTFYVNYIDLLLVVMCRLTDVEKIVY